MRDDRERLLDIKEAIENIQNYAARGRTALEDESLAFAPRSAGDAGPAAGL